MRKRITSLLLTLVMLLSLVPAMGVTASAAETGSGSGTADDPYVVTTYEELQTAMQKAGGGYVRLGKDIDTTSMNGDMGIGFKGQIVVNSNVALDLYSHKVTLMKRGDTERSGLIDVRRGSLTIEDSQGGGELNGKNMLTSKRLYLIECYDGAKVTVNSGKLTMWSAQTAQTANAVIKNSGTVEINGGTLAISNQRKYDEVDFYLAQQDCALSMTSLDGSSVVINGGTFDGRVLLYAHAKSAGKAGSVINGGTFKKSVYVQKDRTKTGNVALDVSIRGGTYHYIPGYYTNDEGKRVSDPQWMFQFATKGFLNGDSTYYDGTPYPHGADPAEGKLDQYDLTAFRSLFPTNAILVAKGQSYTHRDYRTDNTATEVQLVDKLFTGADNTEWARLMNSEYQTIDVVSDIQLEDATLKVGDTTVPDNGGNVTTGDKTITITGKVNKRIAELVNSGKIDLGFVLNVVKTTKPMKYLDNTAATLSRTTDADGRLNVTVTLPSAQLAKADYSVRLDLFPKKPGTTTTPVGEGLLPSGWKLSADSANKLVTINYNNNGGSGTMASQQVMSGKQPYTLPDCTFTAPAAGQVFKGWSTTQDGTGLLSDGKLPLTEVSSSVTVYAIWGVPSEMEINKVTLTVKTYSQRQETNDFRVVDRTPSTEMSYKGFWVYEGLNTKSGSQAGTYDKTKDYSVAYEFEATLGYQFAENISVDDVSANDGEVWLVQLFNDNKTLQVCVNYRSGDSIKGMQLKVKEPLAGDSARDEAYEIRSTDGRYAVEYTDWYQGEFTDNSQLGVTTFTGNFEAGQKYTCAFRVKANDGYKVAPGYTAGLLLNGAKVTNCKELNPTGDDAKGYYGLYTFTVMDTSDKISKVGIQVKPAADRADISTDFGPLSFTPASRMELRTYQIYEGLSQTGGERPTAYDPAKDYSAIYEFTTGESYSFAEGISTSDVTINDGEVWQVTRLNEGKTLQVFVNFYSGDDIIKGMQLKVKEPTAGASSVDAAYQISSTDSRYAVDYTDWYQGEITDNSYSGPKFTRNFAAGEKYTCAFRVKANAGYKVAHGYTGALYLNEAQVTKCTELVPTGDNAEGYLGLYTFTAVDAPDTIRKVTIQVKPEAERTTLNDFACQSYTPDGSMGNPGCMIREGLNTDGTGSTPTVYDKEKDYSVIYLFPLNPGCTIAEDISAADVTINDGQVYKVDSDNDGRTLLVYVNFPAASTAGQVVKTVNIQVKPEAERNALNDFNCQSFTTDGSMGNPGCMIREGLNTDGTGSTPDAYDKNKDYSVIYLFPLDPGCTIAEDISTDDVTINDGHVYKVDSDSDGRRLLVYVNFPSSSNPNRISNVHLNFKPVGVRHQVADICPVNWTPGAGSIELYNIRYYEGENTDADTNKLDGSAAYDRSKAYSVSFQLVGKTGVVFADGFDKNSITLSDGKVWKVQRIGSDKNNVVICVTFPASGDTATKIDAVSLNIKPYDQRHALVDFAPTASTPEGMSVTSTNIYKDGTLYTGSYDANTAYSVGYSLNTKSGYAFADGFTKENVTVSNGTVQSVNVINNNYVIVYVDFPVTGPTPVTETIEKIHLDFKLRSERTTIGDLNPIAQNPGTDKMELAIKYFYEGDTAGPHSLAENEKYESSKNYTAALQYNCKNDVTIAKGFTKEDITISNGTVNQIVRNDKYVIIVVNFPKDPTTDPNYVTEAEVQVAAPVAGEKPSINGITVTSSNADKIERALVLWKFDISYVAGQEYSTTVYLEPKEGVTFADDMKLKVNGKVVDLAKKDTDGSVQFLVKITAVDSSTPAPTEYNVTVTSGGNGTASADFTKATAGKVITLTANADSGYHFKEWQVVKGGVTIKDNKFKMPVGDVEIKAVFEKDTSVPTTYAIKVTSGGNGSASASPAKAVAGTEITLTANADSGYHFKEWQVVKGGVTIKNNKFTMPAAEVEIKAIFEKNASTGGGGGGGSYTPSYTVSVDKTENGTITVSPKSASKGDTVTVTVKPDKGYELDTLKVLDKNGDKVKLTEKNGKYTFTMPAGKVTVKGSFVEEAPEQIFTDVPVDAYCYEAVKWAAEKGITGGVGNGLFAPNQPCTRAQAVTFLWRAAGSPAPKNMSSFTDVPADAFYAKAVAWAVENGITGGTGDGKFSPDATCPRAQIVTFLWRANGSPAVSGNSAFTDVASDAYYAAAVTWAEKNDVTGGIGNGLFGSNNNCTRAQIVTFIYRSVK